MLATPTSAEWPAEALAQPVQPPPGSQVGPQRMFGGGALAADAPAAPASAARTTSRRAVFRTYRSFRCRFRQQYGGGARVSVTRSGRNGDDRYRRAISSRIESRSESSAASARD